MTGGRAPHGAALALRRVGAVAFWGTLQTLFLLPRSLTADGPIRFLVPPLAGALGNAAIAAGFVWWFVVRVLRRGEWWRAAHFRLRRLPAAGWPWVALTAVAVILGVQCALVVLPRVLPEPRGDDGFTAAYLRQPYGALALFVLAAAVAPLLEEFVFRGWMQRGLERRMPAWSAILLTAFVFAAVHAQLFGFPLRLAFAIASGYAAWATRSIWPSVVLHGAYNGSLIVLGALAPRASEALLARATADPRGVVLAVVGLVLAIAVATVALRSLRRTVVHARQQPPRTLQGAVRAA